MFFRWPSLNLRFPYHTSKHVQVSRKHRSITSKVTGANSILVVKNFYLESYMVCNAASTNRI